MEQIPGYSADQCRFKTTLYFFQRSWESRKVSVDWKLTNVVLILKEDKKEDPGNYRPACDSHFSTS